MQQVLGRRGAAPLGARRTVSRCAVVAHASKLPAALLFDCDGKCVRGASPGALDDTICYLQLEYAPLSIAGVLVDTERDGHRISFNKAFKAKGEHACMHGRMHAHASFNLPLILSCPTQA